MSCLKRQDLCFSLHLKHEIGYLALLITLNDHDEPSFLTTVAHSYVGLIHPFLLFIIFTRGFPDDLEPAALPDSPHSLFHHLGSIPARRFCIWLVVFVSICFWSP